MSEARVRLAGVVVLGALLAGAFLYRTHYNVWPGQAAGTRITWCGRHYDGGGGDALSLRQVQATSSRSDRVVGSYPPLGPRSQVVATPCSPLVPTLIFLSAGTDRYVAYSLSGAP